MSEKTQDLITKELVICDAFGELRLKPILFEKNVEYGTNKIIDLLNDLQQENKQFRQANVEFVSQNNKLQHRIYEAIDYIKHSWWLRTDQTYDTSKDLQGWEVEQLLSILERGKQ